MVMEFLHIGRSMVNSFLCQMTVGNVINVTMHGALVFPRNGSRKMSAGLPTCMSSAMLLVSTENCNVIILVCFHNLNITIFEVSNFLALFTKSWHLVADSLSHGIVDQCLVYF